MRHNGLAMLRGLPKAFGIKVLSSQTAKKASRLNLLIYILSNPIELACWCFLIGLNFQTANQRP